MMQELIWLIANDMNFDEAHRRYLLERFPFIEYSIIQYMRVRVRVRVCVCVLYTETGENI